MKRTYTVVLSLVLVCVIGFAIAIVRLTNWNLETMYRTSFENTFYLLTSLVDQNLQHQEEFREIEADNLRSQAQRIGRSRIGLDRESLTDGLQGIWIFADDSRFGVTNYSRIEEEIIRLHDQKLRRTDAHTLVLVEGVPFILSNTATDSLDILILAEAKGAAATGFGRLLDSLVVSTDLRYFSILDEKQTPVIFSSAYENFLPLRGTGSHILDTPAGKIYQIEEVGAGQTTVVAGFAMSALQRIQKRNRLLLVLVVLIFVALEGVLLFNSLRFERFRMKKEEEVHLLKEVGALSSGFAHEFRNSLHTLSLLARDLEGENRELLTQEIARMKSVMDSLRLMEAGGMEKRETELLALVDESISLLADKTESSNVGVEKHIEANATLHGNRSLLVTAFTNILKNSIEAGAQNIVIRAARKGSYLRVQFIDDGKGIDTNIVDKVFDPFFSRKEQSGLGLYLAKRIIEAHGGEIGIRSGEETVVEVRMRV